MRIDSNQLQISTRNCGGLNPQSAIRNPQSAIRNQMNLPNLLTLIRIFIVPLLVVVLLTRFSEDLVGLPQHVAGVSLFLFAAITDVLDGWIARRRQQVSRFGTLLDPIADKLLISAAFISLVENRLAPAWAVVIIIGREFAVSGLRAVAAGEGWAIPASKAGKFKMFSQVVTIALVISSCWSMYGYFMRFYSSVRKNLGANGGAQKRGEPDALGVQVNLIGEKER